MWPLYVAALIAGIANAIQPGQTSKLSSSLAHPFTAGAISMTIGALAMIVAGLALGRLQMPTAQQLGETPWWAWCGGFLGTALLLAQLFVAHRIGAAPFLGLLVTAGVVTSIILDHFGLVGFDVHPASLWRLVGGALMIVGVALVARF